MRIRSTVVVLAALAASLFTASAVRAGDLDLGKPGTPVHLVIGYQPYYTQAWSAVIQKEMKPWDKYLPKGSTVEWEIGLQGAIVGNAMLADKNDIGYMGDMPTIVAISKRNVRE